MSREVLSPFKPKVIISKNLAGQIQYLNHHAPKNKEWSGLLIYQLLNGSIQDLSDVVIKAEAIFPMDFGDSTFTSFEGDDNWLKCFEQFPQIDPITPQAGWYVGKLHTHPDFNVYHSGVDKNDLYVTAPKLPMFLSLIVNYKTEADCELAIAMEVEEATISRVRWKLKGWTEKDKKVEKTEKNESATYVLKCVVEYEQDKWLIDQVEYLKNKPKPVTTYPSYTPPFDYSSYKKVKDENKGVEVRKFVATNVLEHMSDLMTLGEGWALTPAVAIERVNTHVEVNRRADYIKAFKLYFGDYWYDSVFFKMSTTPKEVIQGCLNFMDYHKGWAASVIKQALNELKEEYPKLWEVQKPALVR